MADGESLADMLALLRRIEENTRRTAEAVEALAARSAQDAEAVRALLDQQRGATRFGSF